MSDRDAWVKKNLGGDPAAAQAKAATAGAPPGGSDKQSQAFRSALQPILAGIDGDLAYTAAKAEAAKHDPMAARRTTLDTAAQAAQAQIDPADEKKAKGAIDKVLAAAQAMAGQVKTFRQAAEKAFDDWQAHQPKYDAAGKQVAEMQAWGHAKAAEMQGLADGVRTNVEPRRYAEACKACDQFVTQLAPPYQDYQTQKAAQEKFVPARQALDPRLAAAATSEFKTLEPMQQALTPQVSEMDAAATAKDFVHALELETALEGKVAEYEAKLKELHEQKQAYEDAKAAAQPKLDQANAAQAYKKLDGMKQELAAGQAAMEQAASAEQFQQAQSMAGDLGTKADAYNQAVAEQEQQKKEYEDAAETVKPRVTSACTSKYKTLEPAQGEIAGLSATMQQSAADEDFTGALGQAKDLSTKLDAYEKTVKELEDKEKQYQAAHDALQPKLDAVGKPAHPKLQADEKAITDGAAAMAKSAQDEDFDAALTTAGDLDGKAASYADAVKQLEERKAQYEDAWNKVKPRLDKMTETRTDKLAPMQQSILSLAEEIGKAAEQEEYDEAIKQIDTLNRQLDEYEKADDTEVWKVHYGTNDYYGTKKELAAVQLAITAAAIGKALQPLKSTAEYHAGYYQSLQSLNDKQYIVSWIVEAAGGADLGTVKSAVAAQDQAIAALEQAINGDTAKAEDAYRAAFNACDAAGKALSTYMDKLDVGGGRTIAVLTFVEVSCFAVAAACGGAILIEGGMGALAAGGISNAGFGALEEAAKQGAALADPKGGATWGGAALAVTKAAALNGIGALIGGAAGSKLKATVVGEIVKRASLTNPVVIKEVEKFVENSIGNGVQTVISNSWDVYKGKMTLGQLAVAVAENMLAGGCGGLLPGKMPTNGMRPAVAAGAGAALGVGAVVETAN